MIGNTINDSVTMQGSSGTLLAERYRVVRQLGQGGMGSVWLSEDTQLDGKLFAIKMLPSILVSNKRAYRQLKDEALVAMKLTHPNIVTLRAFEENNGNPFLVMDYIDGETLDDYLADKGNGEWGTGNGRARTPGAQLSGGLPEEEVIRLLKPIAAALDYAHAKGVVHRDVKPGNVMIAKDGTPLILDFGIAREMQETMTRVTGKLSSGTLLYMSPEQLNGEPPKPSQDVYSFAAMAYECLKGEPPFSRGVIEDQIKNKDPEPLAGVSVALARSVMSGLAKKPEGRPATCAAVLEAVDKKNRKEGARGGIGSRWLTLVLVLTTIAVAAYLAMYTDKSQAMDNVVPQETTGVPDPGTVAILPGDSSNTVLMASNETDVASGSNHVVVVAVPTNPAPTAKAPAKPQEGEPAKPAPPEPQPDPKFIDLTNRLANAMAELKCEYDKADHFRDSPRGFESKLGEIEDIWKSREQGIVPSSMDEAQDMLTKITNNTHKISTYVNMMYGDEGNRKASLEKERAFFKWFNGVKDGDANLYASVECKPKWKDELAKLGALTNAINKGDFGTVGDMFNTIKKVMGEILADEQTTIANVQKLHREMELLKQLDKVGFILDEAREPRRPAGTPRKLRLPNGEEMDMVWCPPGWFMMGSPREESGRDGSDGAETLHAVQITKGFWIGKYEVTRSQWRAVMGQGETGRKPKTDVSHEECCTFARKCNARLPTEAEWEYACRAGSRTPYSTGKRSGGHSINKSMANVDAFWGMDDVGNYAEYANAWGINDMHGNAGEWCADIYSPYPGGNSLSVDPHVSDDSAGGGFASHVVRGGHCFQKVNLCRSAARTAGKKDKYTGFRVCYDDLP